MYSNLKINFLQMQNVEDYLVHAKRDLKLSDL